MKIIVLLLAGFCILTNLPAPAQYQDKAVFKNRLGALQEARFSAGRSCLYGAGSREGTTGIRKGKGMANLELQPPCGPEMIFELASITKQFTETAILQLTELGMEKN